MDQLSDITFPWQSRLQRQRFIEHPTTVEAIHQWPELGKTDRRYLRFLAYCQQQLLEHWMEPWRDLYLGGKGYLQW